MQDVVVEWRMHASLEGAGLHGALTRMVAVCGVAGAICPAQGQHLSAVPTLAKEQRIRVALEVIG